MGFRNIFKSSNSDRNVNSSASFGQYLKLTFIRPKSKHKQDIKMPLSISYPLCHSMNLDNLGLVFLLDVEQASYRHATATAGGGGGDGDGDGNDHDHGSGSDGRGELDQQSERPLNDETIPELFGDILNEEVLLSPDHRSSIIIAGICHGEDFSLTKELVSCSRLYEVDGTSKSDTTTFTSLSVDNANVQIYQQPSTLRYINHHENHKNNDYHRAKNYHRSKVYSSKDHHIKDHLSKDYNSIRNDLFNPGHEDLNRLSCSTLKQPHENDIDFRMEYNALLKYHYQTIEKQRSEIELTQRLLNQQKQLNRQLTLALTTNSTSKSNIAYRSSFIPIKIVAPTFSSPIKQRNIKFSPANPKLDESEKFQKSGFCQDLRSQIHLVDSSISLSKCSDSNQETPKSKRYSFIEPKISITNCSSNSGMKENSFETFTIDAKSNNNSTDNLILENYNYTNSTTTTPESSCYNYKTNYDKHFNSIPLHCQ